MTAKLSMIDQTDPSAPYQFSPRAVGIRCGDAVAVTNNSTADHTWSPTHGGFRDSGNMAAGAHYSYTFRYRGKFSFYCAYHPYMTGTVTVS
jgi:plastocyanin